MKRAFIIKHKPSNEEYYKLFVGTDLRNSIEKEIVKFSHRLENGHYSIEFLTNMNDETSSFIALLTVTFNKTEFSKGSIKILNHFAHDNIGTMWKTTPAHVMTFDILYTDNDDNYMIYNAIMSDDIIDNGDNITFTFSSNHILQSSDIDDMALKLKHPHHKGDVN